MKISGNKHRYQEIADKGPYQAVEAFFEEGRGNSLLAEKKRCFGLFQAKNRHLCAQEPTDGNGREELLAFGNRAETALRNLVEPFVLCPRFGSSSGEKCILGLPGAQKRGIPSGCATLVGK